MNGVVQGAYVGHGVSLLPCAYSDIYGSSMYARVSVSGTPDTQLRVWQAVARVNSDGSITDFYPGVLNTYASDLTSATSSQVFGHDLYCAVGGTLVIDTWITDNGYRMGSVQSARFTC
ncbi:hypothetical protein ACFYOD_32810 [Streptomyces sp. NPDC006703]|uniref:hypothetical protein n=1 Tax=Streptomyces sp. NPDC006703 TaxID=3364759 RepID=UPI00369B4A66